MAKVKVDPDVQKLIDEYNSAYSILCRSGEFLYDVRLSAAKTIANVEDLVNSIANHPKTFDTNIEAIKLNKEKFAGAQEFAKQEYENAKKGAGGAAAGVGAGGAIAAMGPTAAMWVATTFGTASTGTAISALSGAAATNAALAWLGGGVAAGGMAAGNALLALAGPIGWGIAGASLVATFFITRNKKKKIEAEKQETISKIKRAISSTKECRGKIADLHGRINDLRYKLIHAESQLREDVYGADYMSLSEDAKLALGALVNNTLSLSELLNKTIDYDSYECRANYKKRAGASGGGVDQPSEPGTP